jgi:prepilin-type N-terminal cleavage/methylation domain-containing protein/prepilin-type processing-associated H-X9-DG protein
MADANSFLSMNSNQSSRRAGAFTLVELLCVIAVVGILAALMLPALNQSQARAKRIECASNLHQQGIAFQAFTHDHNDKFPMAVPLGEGGSQEFVQNGRAAGGEFYFSYRHFQALGNELSSPVVLVCPADTRLPATDFAALQNSNVSYFIGVNAEFSRPDSLLAGDRNLTANSVPNPSILRGEADNRLRWTWEMHRSKGNVLFAGGQVEEWNNTALASAAAGQLAGADLFLPSVLPAPASGGYGNYSGANPGVVTPPPAASPTRPPERPGNPTYGGRVELSVQTPDRPGPPGPPDLARTNPASPPSTNAATKATITRGETEPPMPAFERHLAKILQVIILSTYLLVLLIFLLLLALKSRQRAQRSRAQREHQD